MAELTIYRGNNQIGGCCTELSAGGKRILLDFGANLPDCDSPITDDLLIEQVFDGRSTEAVLFSHPHGDHYGLYQKVPQRDESIPMYIGPLAKEILKTLTKRLDFVRHENGLPIVERMRTYRSGQVIDDISGFRVTPLRTDHSAPDAYMFFIEVEGKRILFTGDFREHGVLGENDGVWEALHSVPKGIDLLITEGTMLSRTTEARHNPIQTEAELGAAAGKLFRERKYNFVLVSSTNLDSMMEFYQNTPPEQHFVCDAYQAELMLTAMADMADRSAIYRPSPVHPVIRVLGLPNVWEKQCGHLPELAGQLGVDVEFRPVTSEELYRDGFVMPVRKTQKPNRKTTFQNMLEKFFRTGNSQIIYSMWKEYLPGGSHPDRELAHFLNGQPVVQLHTSGHAYVETIVRLIETVEPKRVVPMHTEHATAFTELPELAAYRARIRTLQDGKTYTLSELDA